MAETFYNFSLRDIRIPGLRGEVLETTLRLLDKEGTKWEIRTITQERLSLYHRGNQGTMHYQKRSESTTSRGVENLLTYVLRHEEYERKKRSVSRDVSSSKSSTPRPGSIALSKDEEKRNSGTRQRKQGLTNRRRVVYAQKKRK